MATTVGDVAVRVGADVTPLQRSMKRGTSSLDQFGSAAKRTAATTAKYSAAVAAAGAAVVVFSGKVAASNRELVAQSKAANTSVQEFQALSFAARSFGVEQDKLADILKDVNDRVGDFIQTGGGPMADFFENIAPKVGVTADQFARLSGKDALQLYVESLEQANLSQADMTFYMEAIASDSTRLTGLFADNGAEVDRLTQRFNSLNSELVLTSEQNQDLQGLAETFDLLKDTAYNAAAQIAGSLAPELEAFVNDALTWIPQMTNSLIEFLNKFRDAENINAIAQVEVEISRVTEEVEKLQAITESGIAPRMKQGASQQLADYQQRLVELNQQLENLTSNEENVARVQSQRVSSTAALTGGRKDFQDRLDALRESLMTEQELISHNEQEKLALLEEARAADISMVRDYEELKLSIQQEADQKRAELRNKEIEAARSRVERIRESLMNEREIIDQNEQEKLAALEQAAQVDASLVKDYEQLKTDIQRQAAEERTQLEKEEAEKQKKIAQEKYDRMINGASTALGNLSTLMDHHSKEQFKIGKAAAYAQALVDGYAAVVGAYKTGASIGGPVVGAAFAAAAATATAAQIDQIASVKFGGGGSRPTASGGATSDSGATAQTQGATQQQADRVVRVEGLDPGQIFTGDTVTNLARKLVDLQNDGFKLVVA